jgi:hypothetical protein
MSDNNRNTRNIRINARGGTPFAPPSNAPTNINKESAPTREEFQALLNTVSQLTATVEELTRKVTRLEEDTANHERSLTLINFEDDDETLDSQPVIPPGVIPPSRRNGGSAAALSLAQEEDTTTNRSLFRVSI